MQTPHSDDVACAERNHLRYEYGCPRTERCSASRNRIRNEDGCPLPNADVARFLRPRIYRYE